MDGDGQHDPNQISDVVAPILNGEADISIGSRFIVDSQNDHVPRHRRFGIRLITKLDNLGEEKDKKLTVGQSGFRAHSRKAIHKLNPKESGMGVSAEILMDARENGLRFKEVPINCKYDVEGHTARPFGHGLSVIGSMIRYIETEHSMLTFGVPGLIMFVVGLILDAHTWQVYSATSELAVCMALITVIFIIMGVSLGFTGLILHAVVNAAKRKF